MKLPIFLVCVFLAAAGPLPAQMAGDTLEKKAALDAITPWLQEIDKGQMEQAWSEASKKLQQSTNKEQWMTEIAAVREPLGLNRERNQASALLQSGPPATQAPVEGPAGNDAISGLYVVAQFDSSFDNLKYALETVTFVKESDGAWRAISYNVKPKTGDEAVMP